MIDGFVKVAAATCPIRVADCAYNEKNIINTIRATTGAGVRVLVFPELCVTGYTCADLFLQDTLLRAAETALLNIAAATVGVKALVAVGAPLVFSGKLYNCAVVLFDGEILGVVPKANLPDYGEFYEPRLFTRAPDAAGLIQIGEKAVPFSKNLLFQNASLPQMTVGFELCEDLWSAAPPSVTLAAAGATILCNLSASDETVGKADYRRELVRMQSARLLCGYLYADAGDGESTTDLVFAGHNLIAENGVLLNETIPFQNGVAVSELDLDLLSRERRRMNTFPAVRGEMQTVRFDLPPEPTRLTRPIPQHPFVPANPDARDRRCREILNIQAAGLKKRLAHTGAKTAVIGLSGGLDSTLALLVTVLAMDQLDRPHTDITAVTMPCFGTTGRTRSNAERLANALGVTFQEINITDAVRRHFTDIAQPPDRQDVTFENAQARERTQVLMDLANRQNGLVIGTGDLSELALGWATYNGDHMSMYAVNASIPKTLVRYLVGYYADASSAPDARAVLLDILDTPVSPELLPPEAGEIAQKTEEIVGPYDLHDFFLFYLVRYGFPPAKIHRLACAAFRGRYDDATILNWLKVFCRRFFAQQFKRSCMPDGVKVGSVSFSPRSDFRMPSDAVADLWLEELEQL